MASKKSSSRTASTSEPTQKVKFSTVYFDTSVLQGHGWPKISPRLSILFNLASDVGIPCVIPDPVLVELEEKWLREFDERLRKFNDHVSGILEPPAKVGRKELTETYRKAVRAALAEGHLATAPITSRSLEQVFRAAAAHASPFVVPSAFRDGVIQLSILDDLTVRTAGIGGFVVFDEPFSVRAREPVTGIESVLEVFTDLDVFKGVLEQRLSSLQLERVEADRQRLESALREPLYWRRIEGFVAKTLRLKSSPDLRAVKGIGGIRLLRVETPFPPERTEDQVIQASAEIEVSVLVTVAKVLLSQSPADEPDTPKEPSLGVGETNPIPVDSEARGFPLATYGTFLVGDLSQSAPKSEIDEEWKFKIRVTITARYSKGSYLDLAPESLEEVRDTHLFRDLLNNASMSWPNLNPQISKRFTDPFSSTR
jgi:hypothetical protein